MPMKFSDDPGSTLTNLKVRMANEAINMFYINMVIVILTKPVVFLCSLGKAPHTD